MTGRISIYSRGQVDDSGQLGRKPARSFPQPPGLVHELYSMEDVLPTDFGYGDIRLRGAERNVIILRDPANWVASTLQHRKTTPRRASRKVKAYVQLLRWVDQHERDGDCVVIRFDRFVDSRSYRDEVAAALDLPAREYAETALDRVPEFGGGSSFDGTVQIASQLSVMDRWKRYEQDAHFRQLLQAPDLRELATRVFGSDRLTFLDGRRE